MGRLVLGLETGLDGGSISILENEREIDSASGSGSISKSEDLLCLLESLLEKNAIRKREIGFIAVSDAPGSLTGIRIGLAIAKGLGDALSVPVKQISILDAMALLVEREGQIISALATNSNGIYFKKYLRSAGELQTRSEIVRKNELAEFEAVLKSLENDNFSIVLDTELKTHLAQYFKNKDLEYQNRFYELEGSFAEILGRAFTLKRVR